jgi:hypothetical protein
MPSAVRPVNVPGPGGLILQSSPNGDRAVSGGPDSPLGGHQRGGDRIAADFWAINPVLMIVNSRCAITVMALLLGHCIVCPDGSTEFGIV